MLGRIMGGRAIAVVSLLLLGGCALVQKPATLDRARHVVVDGSAFVLVYAPVDEASADEIVGVLAEALEQVERWGKPTEPIFIRIHPTHDALEQAVGRIGYPWLRAWARYDSVDLQSPRTWGLLQGQRAQVAELLTHELTHCVMYQQMATRSNWARKQMPLWFREGMASVTSAQGYRRPSDEEIWRWLRAFPDTDPIADANALYQNEQGIVYGAAHRAFEFFVERYGDDAVRAVLSRMQAGAPFGQALFETTGVEESAFESEFIRYVRWEGWRGPEPASARPLLGPKSPRS